jgi:ATP-dependent DNA ligase
MTTNDAAAAQKTAMSIMETNMSHNHIFPVLYAKDKNGKIKSWSADVFTHSNVLCDQAIQRIMYGYIDGKQQFSYRDYNEGKNIGKKNETTPLMQCISETQRKWLDKKEKEGYTETNPASSTASVASVASTASAVPCDESPIILPMLAQTYNPGSLVSKKHNIVFPCFVQPKLDGLRCVTYIKHANYSSVNPDGTQQYRVIHQSRTGATFEGLAHITESVAGFLAENPNIVLDGELYTDEMPFEELVGLIKKKKIDDDALLRLAKVKYHIYDILDKTKLQMPYTERLRKCVEAVNGCIAVHTNGNTGKIKPVIMVRTIEVKDIPDFKKWFAEQP